MTSILLVLAICAAGVLIESPLSSSRVTGFNFGQGYSFQAADGGVFSYGTAGNFGGMAGQHLNAPIVGSAWTADRAGYWQVGADGGVFNFGDAPFEGSLGGVALPAPIVGIAGTWNSQGYWMVGADGSVYAFGNAFYLGELGGVSDVVGIVPTHDGNGYWLIRASGGVYAYGDAAYLGGASSPTQPISAMATTADGGGYWLVGRDGGVFAFGDASYVASTPPTPLSQPIVGISPTSDGQGYWLVGSDGGILVYGDAQFQGAQSGTALNGSVVGFPTPSAATGPPAHSGEGYYLSDSGGGVYSYGAPFHGSIYSLQGISSQTWFAGNTVGMAASPTGAGYWIVANNGNICNFGSVPVYSGVLNTFGYLANWCWQEFSSSPPTNIDGIQSSSDGGGYFLVGSDGGVFSYGDAGFHGSIYTFGNGSSQNWFSGNTVGLAASPTGQGYWTVSNNGNVCAYGNVPTYSSVSNTFGYQGNWCWQQLSSPVTNIVGIQATPDGGGYWLVGSDGGMFSFGDAPFYSSIYGFGHGSAQGWFGGNIVAMARPADDQGYWQASNNGVVCAYGTAGLNAPAGSHNGFGFWGAGCLTELSTSTITGMAATPTG